MEHLMNTLIENTKENTNTRMMQMQIKQKERDEHLKYILDELYDSIMTSHENVEEKLMDASKRGYDSIVLYAYTSKLQFNTFRVSFLLRGPLVNRRDEGCGLEFFEKKEIKPVINRLKEKFAPMDVYTKYDKRKQENLIIVSWKTKNQ